MHITVNERWQVSITSGQHTGLEIKQAAIAQGAPIQLDFLLSLEKHGGTSEVIGDTDRVHVHEGQYYTAIADDDNS